MMKIIVTAGGTSEPIDEIRAITNKSTGSLGSKIAAEFATRDEVEKVYYVHGKNAITPADPKIELHPIRGTYDLLDKMTELTRDNDIDIIIHSMAVSDYTTASFVSLEEMLRLLAESDCETVEDVREMLEREDFRKRYNKLPSSIDDPIIMLKQTPKVLSHLRDLAPEAVIVGFKLLDHVSHEELMDVASKQIQKNRTDFSMANDYATVVSPVHVGFLLDKEGKELRFDGKDAIAKGVVDNTLELKRG